MDSETEHPGVPQHLPGGTKKTGAGADDELAREERHRRRSFWGNVSSSPALLIPSFESHSRNPDRSRGGSSPRRAARAWLSKRTSGRKEEEEEEEEGGGGCRPGPAPALSNAFVRQKHLPVAGAGSRHDAAEVRCFQSGEPADAVGTSRRAAVTTLL